LVSVGPEVQARGAESQKFFLDMGISKIESRVILRKTGIFVQVGSGKLNELSIMIISAASTASETNISCKNTIFTQVFVENAEKK
jgi:hypothetical protein